MESAAQASASSSVDLPEPFSPTKKVTGAEKVSSCREASTLSENGNCAASWALQARISTDLRKIMGERFYQRFGNIPYRKGRLSLLITQPIFGGDLNTWIPEVEA